MIDVNELRKGVTFEQDKTLFKVTDYHHHKPGRGKATIRIKAYNMRTGSNVEMTFNSSDRVQDVRLNYHNVQFLYSDSEFFYFMDQETFEQHLVSSNIVGDLAGFLIPEVIVKLTLYETEAIEIGLPTSVDMTVTEASAAVRGDTATGVTKLVTVETGMKVGVPSFVVEGDVIKVDTRTGEYLTRA
ncbi:MAG: elongation factor P [Anaerolineaceae bacterium]|nr:elongation factor P [Anaerolineaceae bacterium]